MIRRHQIRTMTALGLSAPLLVGLGIGGITPALAGEDAPAAGAAGTVATAPEEPGTGQQPTDLFTAGAHSFESPQETAVPASLLAQKLDEFEGDPERGSSAHCAEGLDLADTDAVAACTVTGIDGEESTFYAYLAPTAFAGEDYWIYFAKDAPLSEDAAEALNDGLNGTGAYPVFGEEDERTPSVLDPELAVERANFVVDGFGRDDVTVTDVEGEVDLTSVEPVRGTAVFDGSGREVGVTLLPVPSEGESPALMVSIDGP